MPGIPRALGKQIQTLGPNVVEDMFIGLFSCELTYTGVIVFVKFSILALYWRIFSKTNFKIPIAILSSFVFMWGTSVVSSMSELFVQVLRGNSSFYLLSCSAFRLEGSGINILWPPAMSTAKSFFLLSRSPTYF